MEQRPIGRLHALATFALLAMIAGAVYGTTLRHDFVALDDDLLVFANPVVHTLSPSTLRAAFTRYDPELYIPLTFVSFQIDWLVGGGAPWIFHGTNVLLHLCNALLVAWLGWLLTQRRAVGLFAAVLFLVHPINTEAVAWVSARKDLLSACFALGTIVAWLRWRRGWQPGRRIGIELFGLGLLSKISAVVALPYVVLIEWCERRPLNAPLLRILAPAIALAGLFAVIALGGKSHQVGLLNPVQLLLLASENIALTLRHVLVPFALSPFYRHISPVTLAEALPSLGVVAALLLIAVLLRKRLPVVPFAIAWFIVGVVPGTLNAAKAGEVFITSDRYAYLACIAPLIVFAFAVVRLGDVLKPFRGAVRTAGLILLTFLGGLAQGQAALWKDTRTLYNYVLRLDPGIALAHNNLGNADLAEARFAEAEAAYRRGLALQPAHATLQMNLATALERQGRYDEAETLLRAVIEHAPTDRAEAWFRLGNLFAVQRRETEAKDAFAASLALDPSFVLAQAAMDTPGE